MHCGISSCSKSKLVTSDECLIRWEEPIDVRETRSVFGSLCTLINWVKQRYKSHRAFKMLENLQK